jgi:glycosyl transferase family 87
MHGSGWMVHIGIGQLIIYTVPFLLVGNHFTRASATAGPSAELSRIWFRRAYLALLAVTLLAALLMVGRIVWHTIVAPPAWDFQGLWLYGKIVDAGLNPYLPSSFPPIAGPGPYAEHFREQIIDVGAVYPPPSLLFFAAFGRLPMNTAIVPWMLLMTAAFIGMIVLLRRTFFHGKGWEEWAFVLTLALLLPGTIATFGQAQVNFIAVLCVLSAWRSRHKNVSGMYLVIATVMKLLYGFLWFYPLLRRQWKAVMAIAVTGAASMLASIAVLGWKAVATYMFDNPVTHRLPSYYFVFWVNQSLVGGSYRLFPYRRPPFGPPIGHPAYIVSALVVALITVWAVVRQPRNPDGEDTALVLLILAGMLIYPWTLANYFVLDLIPMGFLWVRRNESPLGVAGTIFLLSSIYPLTYYERGSYSLLATILLWLATCVVALYVIRTAATPTEKVASSPVPAAS